MTAGRRAEPPAPPPSPLPTSVKVDKDAVVTALLAYGKELHPTSALGAAQLISDPDANDLVNRPSSSSYRLQEGDPRLMSYRWIST